VFHRGAQDRVDPGLVAWILPEVFQHIAIEPDADLLFGFRHDQRRRGKPIVKSQSPPRDRLAAIFAALYGRYCGESMNRCHQ
jgi:hypothetical protein